MKVNKRKKAESVVIIEDDRICKCYAVRISRGTDRRYRIRCCSKGLRSSRTPHLNRGTQTLSTSAWTGTGAASYKSFAQINIKVKSSRVALLVRYSRKNSC